MTTPTQNDDSKQSSESKKQDEANVKVAETANEVKNAAPGTPDAAKVSETLQKLGDQYDVYADPVVPSSAVAENIAVELASNKGKSATLDHLREQASNKVGNADAGFAAKAEDEDDKKK